MPIPLGVLAVAGAGAAPSGPGVYEWLETTVLGSNQASVVFSNLNSTYGSTYQHLQIRATQRGSAADTGGQGLLRLNGDTNTNSYAMHQLFGTGSSVSSEAVVSGVLGGIAPAGRFPAANATANTFGATIIDVLDAFETTKNKTIRMLGGQASSENRIFLASGLWLSTAAVTSLTLLIQDGSNYVTGSRFSLYGMRSVNP